MEQITINGRPYEVDDMGYLIDWREWDDAFVEALAPQLGIAGGLTDLHWKIIRFVRDHFEATGRCPVVFQTCKHHGLRLKGLQQLFPTGYQRGVCKLAGLSYEVEPYRGDARRTEALAEAEARREARGYRTDRHGFLLDPAEWDRRWATGKAEELGMADGLSEEHWRVISGLRETFMSRGEIPTVYDACTLNGLELEDLERLFPTGYHRGAVKLAGLRLET